MSSEAMSKPWLRVRAVSELFLGARDREASDDGSRSWLVA